MEDKYINFMEKTLEYTLSEIEMKDGMYCEKIIIPFIKFVGLRNINGEVKPNRENIIEFLELNPCLIKYIKPYSKKF